MIPIIIPNYNQITYLKNAINWWRWYSDGEIYVVDNGSDSQELMNYYDYLTQVNHARVELYGENDFISNMTDIVSRISTEKYVISDPDIMPHPNTPPNFLEVFEYCIDSGFHHVGFPRRRS